MLYYTTTSWMMHHWSVSVLACGSSLVLYSGSPFKPHGYSSIPRLLSSLRVTHFGTSAAYLTTLEANDIRPVEDPTLDLSALEAIYSTASPLPPSTFSFVYSAFPRKVNLASITGGTDIISLFGAPCPLLPVRAGEVQCAGLGMAIAVVDSASPPGEKNPQLVSPPGAPGDLVCTKPFPCQPLTFFGPDGQDKYRAAYFDRFPGLWHHGDFVRMDPATGGLVMLGRSDGVLKPAGVRFGSAEIYNILARFFAAEVEDAVCVGRRRETDRDETVCLFVVMAEGKAFDDGLRKRIADVIRRELSPRHVPGVIEEAKGGVPKTGNGKKYVPLALPSVVFRFETEGRPALTRSTGSKLLSSRSFPACRSRRTPASRILRLWTGLENGRRGLTTAYLISPAWVLERRAVREPRRLVEAKPPKRHQITVARPIQDSNIIIMLGHLSGPYEAPHFTLALPHAPYQKSP